jgi:hydrogenase large subunit
MANTYVMEPTPRIEGHLAVEIETNADYAAGTAGTVSNAKCDARMYRGFENILVGRHPGDALTVSQRI